MQGKTARIYDGPLAAKEITPDKRADSVNEKWRSSRQFPFKLNVCIVQIVSQGSGKKQSHKVASYGKKLLCVTAFFLIPVTLSERCKR